MRQEPYTESFATLINNLVESFGLFIPKLLFGIVLILIGLFVASTLKQGVYFLFKLLNLESWFEKAHIGSKKSVGIWKELFAEIVRWTTVILFLVPAVEAWGVPSITDVLNKLLLYIPNVFVAAVVGLVGAVIANFASQIVSEGVKAMGSKSANTLSSISYYAILFFTALVVLNQLGIASSLIQILFTGIVAMLAIAGGLAFGLGGKDMARDILADVRKKLK